MRPARCGKRRARSVAPPKRSSGQGLRIGKEVDIVVDVRLACNAREPGEGRTAMADFWALTMPAAIGAIAWLYQKTWERHERRMKQYEGILDELPAFTVGGLDPDRIDRAIAIHRHLWLLGPDGVVRAFENFMRTVEGSGGSDEERELALGRFVIAMRKDATFFSALVPRFRTTLQPKEFKLKSATRSPRSAPGGPRSIAGG